MQVSPWGAMALNAGYLVLTGLTVPVVDALGFTGHDTQIVAWAGILAVPLNFALHAISSSTPGPLAPPDSPVVVEATKVAQLPANTDAATIAQTKKSATDAITEHQP